MLNEPVILTFLIILYILSIILFILTIITEKDKVKLLFECVFILSAPILMTLFLLIMEVPETIERDGYTYRLEGIEEKEEKPPETIEKYGKTYILVTEEE